ncbi:hypothetical protein H0E84_03355 [Luteimonas sp. SJ-92]|uniref:Redoxin domain-containing protein n=1 Tax=Luteimonas salinisoli TaxID=2752307 RepID=A0A853J9Q9_9GAMM|nr:hypothetical protein [Luteimonas salinisoli]NZA25408.1 hypothetical protein [Luteimonas salinisoli]
MIHIALIVLSLGVVLNLKLTLYLLRLVRKAPVGRAASFLLPVGERLPTVRAQALVTGDDVSIAPAEEAIVLLFLFSKCPKCGDTLPEIDRLLHSSRGFGLGMWLVSEEPAWRLKRFLRGTDVASITLRVSRKDYKALNPTWASPSYLFVNHLGEVEAAGNIGDENWLSFCSQIDEMNEVRAGAV